MPARRSSSSPTARCSEQNHDGRYFACRAAERCGVIVQVGRALAGRRTAASDRARLGGLDAHEPLLRAQPKERDAVRQRYGRDLPCYWGEFVLVGR